MGNDGVLWEALGGENLIQISVVREVPSWGSRRSGGDVKLSKGEPGKEAWGKAGGGRFNCRWLARIQPVPQREGAKQKTSEMKRGQLTKHLLYSVQKFGFFLRPVGNWKEHSPIGISEFPF